jgi:ribose/xylose/arabinose/galactoside ABC-type transport system permease subunit
MKKENKLLKKILSWNEVGTVIPLAILYIFCLVVNPSFFRIQNIMDVLRASSTSLIVAVPVTFLLSSGAMDLSVGSATSLGGVVCCICLMNDLPIPVSILLALCAGGIVGFINGIVCVRHGMPPFIATLGMQYCINGLLTVITKGIAITNWNNKSFQIIGQGKIGGLVPYLVIYAGIVAIIGSIVLSKTKYGRSVLAVGGNKETSFLAGIDVEKIKISCNVLVSVFAAFAGVLIASRFANAQPAAGSGTEMTIMASCIIGGTSHKGGTASILGTVLGCILLGSIQNALIVMGVSTFYMNLIYGLILLAALYIDKYRRKALGLQ